MKHPIIPSLGLAILVGISFVTPASATMSLNYTGGFGCNWPGVRDEPSTLGGVALVNGTPFLMTAVFDEKSPSSTSGSDGWFSATSFSFLIGDNTYTGSSGLTFLLGPNRVALHDTGSGAIASGFSTATPAFNGAQPTATVFSGSTWNEWESNFHLDLDGVTGGLDIKGLSASTTPTASLSMSAVPEVTSSFTMLGLISSGLLLRRRTKRIRTLNVEH